MVGIFAYKVLRAKAIEKEKPILDHENSYDLNLSQTKLRDRFRVWICVFQSLIQNLNQNKSDSISDSEQKNRFWFRVWFRECKTKKMTRTDSESVLNRFWKTSWFGTELLWKIGTGIQLHLLLIIYQNLHKI